VCRIAVVLSIPAVAIGPGIQGKALAESIATKGVAPEAAAPRPSREPDLHVSGGFSSGNVRSTGRHGGAFADPVPRRADGNPDIARISAGSTTPAPAARPRSHATPVATSGLHAVGTSRTQRQPHDSLHRPVRSSTGEELVYRPSAADTVTAGKSVSSSPPTSHRAHAAEEPAAVVASSPQALNLAQEWRVGVFGSGIGSSGLAAGDFDGDGKTEIIAGGSTSTFGDDDFWYVLRHDPATQTYAMAWVSDSYPVGITALSAFDVNGDGAWETFVGLANGVVHVYSGSNHQLIGVLSGSGARVTRLLFSDVDNDSAKELVVVSGSATDIFRRSGFWFTHAAAVPYGGSDAAIGNVDADPALEFVLSSGYVLGITRLTSSAGVSAVVEWTYAEGPFGRFVQLADTDADGLQEIVAAADWDYITAFDADVQSPQWQIVTSHDIGALRLADTNDDGVAELLYGDGQWGRIHCLNVQTRSELWSIANPEHGVTDIGIIDADADGNLEVFWGAGATSTGTDALYVHELGNPVAEWHSQQVDGPFTAIALGDTDDNGSIEIVTASFSSDSGYEDGIIQVYDGATHDLLWSTSGATFGRYAWTGVHDVKIGNVDASAEPEIVVATDRLYDGALYVLDSITHSIKASYFYDDGASLNSLAIADVDADCSPEIIAGGGREHTGAPGVYVYVIDGTTGAVEWKSVNLGAYWSAIRQVAVADIDGDGVKEIIALNDKLYVFDGISHIMWQTTSGGYRSIEIFDVNNDGQPDIVAADTGGSVVAYDGKTRLQIITRSVSHSPIDAFLLRTINNELNMLFISYGRAQTCSFSDGVVSVVGGELSSYEMSPNALVKGDVDLDGRVEYFIGADHAVYQLEGP
jgi:hypothetical protein